MYHWCFSLWQLELHSAIHCWWNIDHLLMLIYHWCFNLWQLQLYSDIQGWQKVNICSVWCIIDVSICDSYSFTQLYRVDETLIICWSWYIIDVSICDSYSITQLYRVDETLIICCGWYIIDISICDSELGGCLAGEHGLAEPAAGRGWPCYNPQTSMILVHQDQDQLNLQL